ncbi:hypothetical protein O987_18495 [Comamonas testosteroni TK102]|uniref:N-acetyltransferase domain-containing protein n=2 Tax=Comamonadaceae TaxID=80864 RepID=A0A076PSZ5_COMTE|nr:hypothetical protein O987_18495 [Comamonas testosteroni TK102]
MSSDCLSMPRLQDVSIQRVRELHQVHSFLQSARVSMFGGRIASLEIPEDLRHFEETYLSGSGCMLAALDADQSMQATIACRDYDGRFAQLDFGPQKVVEVVRLFVAPQFRRSGVGQAMLDVLMRHALAQQVQVLYLHTHPFLQGALEFWQRQGFAVIEREEDPLWQTVHMQRLM